MGKFRSGVGVSGFEQEADQSQEYLANRGTLEGNRYVNNTGYIKGRDKEMRAAMQQAGPSVGVTQGAVGPVVKEGIVPLLGEASSYCF